MSFEFSVTPDVLDLGVKIKAVVIRDIDNETITPEYLQYRKEEIERLLEKYENYDTKQDPIVQGFYDLHAKVHVKRRKNPPASENLIKLLQKRKDLPSVNKVVDIYNIISTDSGLALGAHDIDHIDGNVTLKLTTGSEKFVPLGQTEPKPVAPGEYSYIDDSNEIICRLEIRQVEKTKVDEKTKNLYFIVQGNENTEDELLEETSKQLIETITKYCGGTGEILY